MRERATIPLTSGGNEEEKGEEEEEEEEVSKLKGEGRKTEQCQVVWNKWRVKEGMRTRR